MTLDPLLTADRRIARLQRILCANREVHSQRPEDIMSQADTIHIGASAIGASLISAIVVNDQMRRAAAVEAQAEANSVRSVRRLAAMLARVQTENAALRAGRAALEAEVEGLRYDLECAHAALRRVL